MTPVARRVENNKGENGMISETLKNHVLAQEPEGVGRRGQEGKDGPS